jgi:fimbrial chaperone protein
VRLHLLVSLGLALCQAGRASAAGINVSPVQLHLSKDESKSQLDVKNDGAEPTRFQLSVMVWNEDPVKGMQLTPTQDIVFFPTLLTLKPGEQRAVRVGALPQQFGLVEKTYRLFVEELPAAEKPGQSSQVRVLTRVGIPIFLAPSRKLETSQVDLKLAPPGVEADVRNTGNVHLRVMNLTLKAFDAAGAPLLEKTQQGWYVLANGHKAYRFDVPEGTCAKVRRLIVSVHTDDERTISQALDSPTGTCGK